MPNTLGRFLKHTCDTYLQAGIYTTVDQCIAYCHHKIKLSKDNTAPKDQKAISKHGLVDEWWQAMKSIHSTPLNTKNISIVLVQCLHDSLVMESNHYYQQYYYGIKKNTPTKPTWPQYIGHKISMGLLGGGLSTLSYTIQQESQVEDNMRLKVCLVNSGFTIITLVISEDCQTHLGENSAKLQACYKQSLLYSERWKGKALEAKGKRKLQETEAQIKQKYPEKTVSAQIIDGLLNFLGSKKPNKTFSQEYNEAKLKQAANTREALRTAREDVAFERIRNDLDIEYTFKSACDYAQQHYDIIPSIAQLLGLGLSMIADVDPTYTQAQAESISTHIFQVNFQVETSVMQEAYQDYWALQIELQRKEAIKTGLKFLLTPQGNSSTSQQDDEDDEKHLSLGEDTNDTQLLMAAGLSDVVAMLANLINGLTPATQSQTVCLAQCSKEHNAISAKTDIKSTLCTNLAQAGISLASLQKEGAAGKLLYTILTAQGEVTYTQKQKILAQGDIFDIQQEKTFYCASYISETQHTLATKKNLSITESETLKAILKNTRTLGGFYAPKSDYRIQEITEKTLYTTKDAVKNIVIAKCLSAICPPAALAFTVYQLSKIPVAVQQVYDNWHRFEDHQKTQIHDQLIAVTISSILIAGAGKSLKKWKPNLFKNNTPLKKQSKFKGKKPIGGKWIKTNEYMPKTSAEYQTKVTGQPSNCSYELNGVKFDGLKNGILIEAKGNFKQFIDKTKNVFHDFFKKGKADLINQAERQVKAANGPPIQWVCKDKELVDVLTKLFKSKEGLHVIELVHLP